MKHVKFISLFSFICTLLFASPGMTSLYPLSQTFNVSINGLPEPSEIRAVTIWFEVSNDFSFDNLTLGDAIPTGESGQVLGWEIDKAAVTHHEGKRVFKFGVYDQDDAFLDHPFNLRNGTIVSFDYDGTIVDLALVQFGVAAGVNIADRFRTASLGPSGVNFAPVPLPPSALLLMAGLVGMATIKRKNN